MQIGYRAPVFARRIRAIATVGIQDSCHRAADRGCRPLPPALTHRISAIVTFGIRVLPPAVHRRSRKAVATLEPNYRDFGRHSYMHRCIVCSCTVERDTRKTNMLCCTSQGGCPPFPWTRASSASPKISERAENTLEMPRRRAEGAAELQS